MASQRTFANLLALLLAGIACLSLTSCSSLDPGGNAASPPRQTTDLAAGNEPPAETPPPPSEAPATSPPLSPNGPLELTVEDAVLLALENNNAFRVQRLNPPIRRTFEQQERAAFDPVLTATASKRRADAQRLARAGAETESFVSDTTSGELSVSTLLPTGTTVALGTDTEMTESSLYRESFASTRLGLTVTQALLRGLGTGVNLATLRQARLDTLASQYELRGFAEWLVAQVETAYWDYALARRQIEIFTQSLKLAEDQQAETVERIQVGALAETELAAAQAEMALRREDLINARSSLATIRLRLLRLVNPPGASPWEREVVLQDHPVALHVTLDDVESHVRLASRMRSDLNQARLQVKRGDLELVKTRNGLLPRLDLFVTLGMTGYAKSFGRSFGEIGTENYDVLAGLTLEYPVANRDASARHHRAILSNRQNAEALGNLAQLVEVDVRSAYVEVNRASEQVAATSATRALQEEKLRAETEKFRVGKSTTLLVAQAQRDLVASQISEIQAVVNHRKALVELYRLEGSLLERRGILAPVPEPVSPSFTL